MTDEERDKLLIRLETKMDTAHERINDHGKRLKALEMARNIATGAGAVLGVIWTTLKLNISVRQGQ